MPPFEYISAWWTRWDVSSHGVFIHSDEVWITNLPIPASKNGARTVWVGNKPGETPAPKRMSARLRDLTFSPESARVMANDKAREIISNIRKWVF